MARRTTPDAESPATLEGAPTQVPLAVWVKDRFVCVEIIDPPPGQKCDGVCRCPACHGAAYEGIAAQFYPEK